MLIAALLMSAALTTPPAGEPDGAQDSVVATAPATSVNLDAVDAPVAPPVAGTTQSAAPHGLSTDQQIAQWLAARTPVEGLSGHADIWSDDRKPHGEVSVGIGTGGYRHYAAAVSLPLGERGRLDISVSQVENGYGYPYGYGYGPGYGYEPYFDDAGYAFPGARKAGAAAEYERRVARPEGPPWARRAPAPQQSAPE